MPSLASLKATREGIVRNNLAIKAVDKSLGNPDLVLFPGREDASGPGGLSPRPAPSCPATVGLAAAGAEEGKGYPPCSSLYPGLFLLITQGLLAVGTP